MFQDQIFVTARLLIAQPNLRLTGKYRIKIFNSDLVKKKEKTNTTKDAMREEDFINAKSEKNPKYYPLQKPKKSFCIKFHQIYSKLMRFPKKEMSCTVISHCIIVRRVCKLTRSTSSPFLLTTSLEFQPSKNNNYSTDYCGDSNARFSASTLNPRRQCQCNLGTCCRGYRGSTCGVDGYGHG